MHTLQLNGKLFTEKQEAIMKQTVSDAFEAFRAKAQELESEYGDHLLQNYLTNFQARICAQITSQLELINKRGLQSGRMLSLGGWPGIAPIILNQLTGIEITIVDHPALLTPSVHSSQA